MSDRTLTHNIEATTNRPDSRTFIPINKIWLNPATKALSGFSFDVQPSPDDLRTRLNRDYNEVEISLALKAMKPPELLASGFKRAQDFIADLRTQLGLSHLIPEQMRIALLEEEYYLSLHQSFLGADGLYTAGFATDHLNSVVVRNMPNLPSYFLASVALHELVHKHLETIIVVYSSDKGPEDGFHSFTESRRSGLRVKRNPHLSDTESSSDNVGDFLNELSNMLIQSEFISHLEEIPEQNNEFSAEFQAKRRHVENVMGNHSHLIVNTVNGLRVAFHSSIVHFTKSGECLLEKLPISLLLMQLGHDLSLLCGESEGVPLWKALLKAKVNPRLQNFVRRTIDNAIEPGFYSKLKNTNMNTAELLQLITSVQSKLYELPTPETNTLSSFQVANLTTR